MSERPFPKVIVMQGLADASGEVIVINERDACISRGGQIVTFGLRSSKPSNAFFFAKTLLLAHPQAITSTQLMDGMYGEDSSQWPHDRYSAVSTPLADLRHRLCKRLGLQIARMGISAYRIETANQKADVEVVNHSTPMVRKLAHGRAKPNRLGIREFNVSLSLDDADAVRGLAAKHNVSFAEALRTLVQWGFASMGEA